MGVKIENCLVLSLLLVHGITNTLESNTSCGQNSNTGPPLPPLSQHSFRAEIACKMIERNRSVHAIQTVSLEANKTSLFWTAANSSQFFIYDKATDQAIAGDAVGCSELAHDDPLRMLVSSTMQALEGEAEYINSTQIKGIPVNHWRKCSSWAAGINFTMDIYITENHVLWDMPSVLPDVPIRIDLTGQMLENGKITPIHHIYDYILFEQFEGDRYNSAFQPPAGVLCPGLQQEIPIPDMPTSLSYSSETTVSDDNYIETITELQSSSCENGYLATLGTGKGKVLWHDAAQSSKKVLVKNTALWLNSREHHSFLLIVFYDFDNKISRTDYFDGTREVHLVKDFNEGVVYKMDMVMDSCEILSMAPQENDTYTELNWQHVLDDNGYVQMKTIKDYFLLTGNFTFEGEHEVRGIPCDLYSCKVQNYKGYQGWTLIGLYFSKSHIQVYNTRGSVDFMENQLMRFTVENEKVTASSDIYNMDPQPTPIKNPFDVSKCFSASSQIPFVIDFSLEAPIEESQDLYSFRKAAVQQIAQTANVSFFRVHWDDISIENYMVNLYGKILDVPPALETTNNPKPTSLVEAWSRLRESVYKEQLEVIFVTPNSSSSMVVYTGEGISNLNPTSEDLEWAGSPLYDYTEVPGVQLYSPLIQNDSFTLDDCARLCSNTLSFQCLTFVYCKDSPICALHDVSFSERMPHSMSSSCNAYSRSYVKDFEQILDTSITAASDPVIMDIDDREQCAYLCLTNTTFLCESFEMCSYSGESLCYLGHIHIYDLPRDDINEIPDCVHYSRNYATDFDEISNKKTNYAVDRTISGVTVTQCAWICSTQTSYSCSVFQFCDTQGLCQLINSNAQNIVPSFIDKDSCSIFTRKKNSRSQTTTTVTTITTNQQKFETTASYKPDNVTMELMKLGSSGYSEGAMAGLAMGMIALGIILCVLGIFIYVRVHRSNKDSTDTVELSLDEHLEHS